MLWPASCTIAPQQVPTDLAVIPSSGKTIRKHPTGWRTSPMRRRSRVVGVMVALASLSLFLTQDFVIPSAGAQSATTSLRGAVSDSKGLLVPGADVTLSNGSTGFVRTTKTDGQGVYQFLEVPPANYVLTVAAAGFAKVKRDNVLLQVSSPATLNVSLQVAGGSVTVEVTSEAPMVNTTDATLGN